MFYLRHCRQTVQREGNERRIQDPREVFQRAILNNSSHVIIAHNHPTGDPSPSGDDITTTKRLVESGKILGISVADHIIVAHNSFVSLKQKGFI